MASTSFSASIGKVLLVSDDAAAIGQITESLQRLAVSVQVCHEVAAALDLVNQRKFEAVMVDCRLGERATTFLEKVRQSASNQTAVTFAISDSQDESSAAFRAGSSFVLARPLTADAISRTINAAYGLIVRERRRYFRCPIMIPVAMQYKGEPEVSGQTVNVSERGMALSIPVALSPGNEVTVQFTLPDLPPIAALSKVCWSNEKGQAGLLFLSLSATESSNLQGWLARQLEKQLPSSVAEKFRQPDRS